MLTNTQIPLVSWIVPVYNAASFIERCINSVLQQPQAEHCELILINDGSTDNSLMLMEQYREHPGVKIIDKPNGGVSSARNQGLAAARGAYIGFIDADDYLPPDALSIWQGLMKPDIALAVGESESFTQQGEPVTQVTASDAQRRMSAVDATNELLYFTPKHGICDKFFCGDLIREHQLRFREDIFNFEDLLFVISYLAIAGQRQVVFSGRIVYHYVESENSATRSTLKEKHFSFARSFATMKTVLQRPNDRFYYYLFLKVASSHIYKALHTEGFSRAFVNEYIGLYRQNYRSYLSSGLIPNVWSLYFTLFFLSPRLVSGLRHLAQKNTA